MLTDKDDKEMPDAVKFVQEWQDRKCGHCKKPLTEDDMLFHNQVTNIWYHRARCP